MIPATFDNNQQTSELEKSSLDTRSKYHIAKTHKQFAHIRHSPCGKLTVECLSTTIASVASVNYWNVYLLDIVPVYRIRSFELKSIWWFTMLTKNIWFSTYLWVTIAALLCSTLCTKKIFWSPVVTCSCFIDPLMYCAIWGTSACETSGCCMMVDCMTAGRWLDVDATVGWSEWLTTMNDSIRLWTATLRWIYCAFEIQYV